MEALTAQDARDSNGLHPEGPSAILRGTARGLEMVIDAHAPLAAIIAELELRLGEAPAFFRNSDVRVTVVNGPLPAGALSSLDDLAQRFELRVVEVGARSRATFEAIPDAAPGALGSTPTAIEPAGGPGLPATTATAHADVQPAPVMAAPAPVVDVPPSLPVAPGAAGKPQPRIVEGPVRSGVILEHVGHLIVFGDVNPGAEVRATGNIVVLGCLRGTAHAAIGRELGFILALQLEPRQLRIGRKVARADANTVASGAEIAYATSESIVVERYSGRLPRNLSASM